MFGISGAELDFSLQRSIKELAAELDADYHTVT